MSAGRFADQSSPGAPWQQVSRDRAEAAVGRPPTGRRWDRVMLAGFVRRPFEEKLDPATFRDAPKAAGADAVRAALGLARIGVHFLPGLLRTKDWARGYQRSPINSVLPASPEIDTGVGGPHVGLDAPVSFTHSSMDISGGHRRSRHSRLPS